MPDSYGSLGIALLAFGAGLNTYFRIRAELDAKAAKAEEEQEERAQEEPKKDSTRDRNVVVEPDGRTGEQQRGCCAPDTAGAVMVGTEADMGTVVHTEITPEGGSIDYPSIGDCTEPTSNADGKELHQELHQEVHLEAEGHDIETSNGTLRNRDEGASKEEDINISSNEDTEAELHWSLMFLLGLLASFLSSITGTGGPLILFPVMFMARPDYPMKQLMGLSTPFSATMVVFSCFGVALFGKADMGLSLTFAIVSSCAIFLGGTLMETLGDSSLKAYVGVVMMVVGLVVAGRTIADMV